MKILDKITGKIIKKNASEKDVDNLKALGLWGVRYVEAKKLPELEGNHKKKEDK